MKRFALIFALVLMLAISASAQDFGDFTAEVPEGWTAKPMPSVSTVIFLRNDNNAMISLVLGDSGNLTAKQFADSLSAIYKQQGYIDMTAPEEDGNGNYIVNMKNQHKLPSRAIFSVKNGKACIILLVGLESGKEDMKKILDSVVIVEKKSFMDNFKFKDDITSFSK